MKKLFSVLSVLSLAFFFAVGCLEKKAEVKKPKLDITSAPAGRNAVPLFSAPVYLHRQT